MVITIVISLMGMLASLEMNQHLKAYRSNARVVAAASELLGLFRDNEFGGAHKALYPEKWKNWGQEDYRGTRLVPWFHIQVVLSMAAGISALAWLL